MRLLYDVETNGLYFDLTVIHCISILDLDTGDILTHNDQGNRPSIATAVTMLDSAELLVGHNILYYDNPVIQKFYPFFNGDGRSLDTLLLGKLRFPELMRLDCIHQPKDLPRKLYGSNSLKAWGIRLGEHKGDFAEQTDWSTWSPEMEDYCEQDLKVTSKLFRFLCNQIPGLLDVPTKPSMDTAGASSS
jgi:hypothetical protein